MNDSLNFTRNEHNALTNLVNDLRSENGFIPGNENIDNEMSLVSTINRILIHCTTLKDETARLLHAVGESIVQDDRTPLANCWFLPNQRAAADDIESTLLNPSTATTSDPAPAATASVFTDDERLYLNGMLGSLYLMDQHLKVLTGDAREPIISGLHKLAELFHEDEPTATKNLLRTLAGMVEYGIEGYVNEDTREELLWPAIHKLSKA